MANDKPSTLPFNIAAAVCFAAAIAVMGVWVAHGSHFVTQYEVMVEETVEDEFGDEFTTEVMQDEFRFGLMPDERGYDGAAPLAGGFTVLGLLIFGIGWWRKRKSTADTSTE